MTGGVIYLPAGPVRGRRLASRKTPVIGLLMSLSILSSCTTFGTNIKGSFACSAPGSGTCAPATVIDDKALAEISGDSAYRPTGPYQAPARDAGPQRIALGAHGDMGMSPQKVLRIVFPAHVDGAGRYHETSVVQAVVDNGAWLAATDGHGPALASTSVLNVSPDILSKLGGPNPDVTARTQTPAQSVVQAPAPTDPFAPSPQAVATARAKARGSGKPTAPKVVGSSAPPAPAKPELASTGAANRPAAFNPHVDD